MGQNTQYAVIHLQRGSGNDAGLTAHIERKTADGRHFIPDNAEPSRTHLNRELIRFPEGVTSRTAAIQHRIDNAGLPRKVGKNQTKAIRIILSGSHEQMTKIASEGKLDNWIAANIDWLQKTYGEENVVSAVLHMDEKTPHLHATVVPIVTSPRQRRKREGERKYQEKESGPRLSCDDVMARRRLFFYQSSYAKAMNPFGLERGILGSTAKHNANNKYYRDQLQKYESDIAKLQEEIEKLAEKKEEGKSLLLSWIGKGDLKKARQTISEKDEEIDKLKAQIAQLKAEKKQLISDHRDELAKQKDCYQKEINAAIARAERAEKDAAAKGKTIEDLKAENKQLEREAHPERYRLSSGAILDHIFVPNYMYPDLHIWTIVGNEKYDVAKNGIDYNLAQRHLHGQITDWEFVNAVFEPIEQISETQYHLLCGMVDLATGGSAQPHIGMGGGGGPQSETGWDGKKKKKGEQQKGGFHR